MGAGGGMLKHFPWSSIPAVRPADRRKQPLTSAMAPSDTICLMAKQNPSSQRSRPNVSRPRAEADSRRPSGRPPSTQRDHQPKHLLEHISAVHVVVGLGIFLLLVGGAFFLLSDTGAQNLGAEARQAMKKKNWKSALEYWSPLASRYPKSPVIHMSMGECLLNLGDAQRALDHLNKAVEHIEETRGNTEMVSGLFALRGWARLELGQVKEGLDDLYYELQINPDHPLANYRLAKFFESQQDYINAGPCYQRLANNPEYAKDTEAFKEKVGRVIASVPESEVADLPEKAAAGKLEMLPPPPEFGGLNLQ